MNKIKQIVEKLSKIKKSKLILIPLNIVLIIICFGIFLNIKSTEKTLQTQGIADFWQGDNEQEFAQISAFFPVDADATNVNIEGFRDTIDQSLADGGVVIEEDEKIYVDSFYSFSQTNIQGVKQNVNADLVGVGGDFFTFHPLKLHSGSYIYPQDVMKDRLVLSYELAWSLFGSTDVAGMSVTIGGKPYYVAGVVYLEDDEFSKKAKGEDFPPQAFVSYEGMEEITGEAGIISGYEIVLPNQYENFAKTIVEQGFKMYGCDVLENSNRYSFKNISSMLTKFGERAIVDSGMSYPYFENAARISEDVLALKYGAIALFGLIPFLTLVYLGIMLIRYFLKKIRQGKEFLKESWSDRYGIMEKRREKKAIKKELSFEIRKTQELPAKQEVKALEAKEEMIKLPQAMDIEPKLDDILKEYE